MNMQQKGYWLGAALGVVFLTMSVVRSTTSPWWATAITMLVGSLFLASTFSLALRRARLRLRDPVAYHERMTHLTCKAAGRRDFRQAINHARHVIANLPHLIDRMKARGETLDRHALRAVEIALRYEPFINEGKQLDWIGEIISSRHELAPWRARVAQSKERARTAAAVRERVHATPGVKQASLGSEIGVSDIEIVEVINDMERAGVVRRDLRDKLCVLFPE